MILEDQMNNYASPADIPGTEIVNASEIVTLAGKL